MAEEDHVFTADELVNKLASFTDALSDDIKASLDPSLLASLEDVTDGINQSYGRIDNLNQTITDLNKANEDYRAKIAAYAAEKADRMRQTIEEKEADDPAEEALKVVMEDDD